MRSMTLLTGALLSLPLVAAAQGVTQSRDGLPTASQGKESNNPAPAGSINATTGPQSAPAYPSGSSSPNPGAAFVQTMPRPESGPATQPSGIVSTQTQTGGGAVQQPASPGVAQAPPPPKQEEPEPP